MNTFTYKEQDEEGQETLEVIAAADKFNDWMAETILPHMKGEKVLEVGSGIGNISYRMLGRAFQLTLTDIRPHYCEQLEQHFKDHKEVEHILQLDLVHPQFEEVYRQFIGYFDTVFALNVIEHIEDDSLAIANCKKLLKDGGRLVILVPAYQWLYNNFDRQLYHFRRYTRKTMTAVFNKNAIPVLRSFHFNVIGMAGWFVTGAILKKDTIPAGQMGLYNKLVPVFKLIDKIFMKQIGLSVIVVGQK